MHVAGVGTGMLYHDGGWVEADGRGGRRYLNNIFKKKLNSKKTSHTKSTPYPIDFDGIIVYII